MVQSCNSLHTKPAPDRKVGGGTLVSSPRRDGAILVTEHYWKIPNNGDLRCFCCSVKFPFVSSRHRPIAFPTCQLPSVRTVGWISQGAGELPATEDCEPLEHHPTCTRAGGHIEYA